jgi:chemotaxis signal transduction protein
MNPITDPLQSGCAGNCPPCGARDVLVVQLGGEQFGIDICSVRECVHFRALTAVMDGATRVPGVALWRGALLPLIDLRTCCDDMAPPAPTDIIILTRADGVIGITVDAALEVIRQAGEQSGSRTDPQRRPHLPDIETLLADGKLVEHDALPGQTA